MSENSVMQVTFKNVRWDGTTITAEGNHNCGEHLFNVKLEGADCIDSENLKLFTVPEEYAKRDLVKRGAISLLCEVLKIRLDYIEETGFIYSLVGQSLEIIFRTICYNFIYFANFLPLNNSF